MTFQSKLINTVIVSLTISLLVFSGNVGAESWGTDYEVLFEKYESQVVIGKNSQGDKTRTLNLPGKTKIIETRKNGKVRILSVDISGKGAVGCGLLIYIGVRNQIDICPNLKNPKAERQLDWAIDEIIKFSADNMVPPGNVEHLKRGLQSIQEKRNKKYQSQRGSEPPICPSKLTSVIIKAATIKSGAEFRSRVNEMLSVPRLPVTNPCL